jgi:glycosyltransferase involved in cell wall biosynthesis
MTRVCHFSSVHRADDVRIAIKECPSLARAGYEMHLVIEATRSGMERGVQVHALPPRPTSRLARMLGSARRAYATARDLDAGLYHFHDPELLPWALALKRSGKRVVYDAHEDVPRDIESKAWIPAPLRQLVGAAFERFEDWAAARVDAVVAATPHIRDRFLEVNPRTVDVNNYPLRDEMAPTSDAAREPRVCYVGGINRIRGVHEMVRAIERTPFRLALAGRFDREAEREVVAGLPGWRQVDELGHLPRAEVARLLATCLAGLVLFHPETNHVNAQPNKLFEYMSAGLPVIASNFPLWREVVEGSGCGLCVDPLDPDGIATAIRWIGDHPKEASKMGRRGREAVVTRYNWDREAAKLVALYRSLGIASGT